MTTDELIWHARAQQWIFGTPGWSLLRFVITHLEMASLLAFREARR